MAEAIQMPFGSWTWVGRKKHKLNRYFCDFMLLPSSSMKLKYYVQFLSSWPSILELLCVGPGFPKRSERFPVTQADISKQ